MQEPRAANGPADAAARQVQRPMSQAPLHTLTCSFHHVAAATVAADLEDIVRGFFQPE
jgi:hypothetical protein